MATTHSLAVFASWTAVDSSKARVATPRPENLLATIPETLLAALQRRRRPLAGYMSIVQTDVHPGMRSILVDWLVEVSLVSLIRQRTHPSHSHAWSSLGSPMLCSPHGCEVLGCPEFHIC